MNKTTSAGLGKPQASQVRRANAAKPTATSAVYEILPLGTLNSIVTRNFGATDAKIPRGSLRKIHGMLNLDRIHRTKGEALKEAEVCKQLRDILDLANQPELKLYSK